MGKLESPIVLVALLMVTLFGKNAPKLVLLLPEKSAIWPKKSKKSDLHFLASLTKQKLLANFPKYGIWNMEYGIKVNLPNVSIKFLEEV